MDGQFSGLFFTLSGLVLEKEIKIQDFGIWGKRFKYEGGFPGDLCMCRVLGGRVTCRPLNTKTTHSWSPACQWRAPGVWGRPSHSLTQTRMSNGTSYRDWAGGRWSVAQVYDFLSKKLSLPDLEIKLVTSGTCNMSTVAKQWIHSGRIPGVGRTPVLLLLNNLYGSVYSFVYCSPSFYCSLTHKGKDLVDVPFIQQLFVEHLQCAMWAGKLGCAALCPVPAVPRV